MNVPSQYVPYFDSAAKTYGVPAILLQAIAYVESRFNSDALNTTSGASGLMQIMPGNFQDLGITDPFNPQQSVNGAAKLLSKWQKSFANWEKTLAAYVWGPANVQAVKNSAEYPSSVKSYVANVLRAAGMSTSIAKSSWHTIALTAIISVGAAIAIWVINDISQ